jgi:hypothetical protein
MTVSIQWDNNEHTVLRYDFLGRWTWAEYHQALRTAFEMMASVSYEVDIIADFTQSSGLPSNAISGFAPSTKSFAPNAGHAVVVIKARFFEMLLNSFSKVYSWNGKITKASRTVEEARTILASLREKVVR